MAVTLVASVQTNIDAVVGGTIPSTITVPAGVTTAHFGVLLFASARAWNTSGGWDPSVAGWTVRVRNPQAANNSEVSVLTRLGGVTAGDVLTITSTRPAENGYLFAVWLDTAGRDVAVLGTPTGRGGTSSVSTVIGGVTTTVDGQDVLVVASERTTPDGTVITGWSPSAPTDLFYAEDATLGFDVTGYLGYFTQAVAGATGQRTASYTTGSGNGVGVMMALQPVSHLAITAKAESATSVASLNLTVPAGVTASHLGLISVLTVDGVARTWTVPGWTQRVANPSGSGNHAPSVFTRLGGQVAGDTITVTLGGVTTAFTVVGAWYDTQGRDISDVGTPWTRNGVTGASTQFPGVDVTGGRDILLVGTDRTAASQTVSTWSPSAPLSSTYTVSTDRATLAHGVLNALITQSIAGTSPTYTATLSASSGNAMGVQLVLDPPVGKDASPPTAPGSVKALASSATQVTITWTASTDNVGVTGYTVRRNGVDLPGTVTGLSFTDNTTIPDTTYTYSVSAFDAAGNRSVYSAAPAVTTPTATGLVKIAGASFENTGNNTITLTVPSGVSAGHFGVLVLNSAVPSDPAVPLSPVVTPGGWTPRVIDPAGQNNHEVAIWTRPGGVAAGEIITVTFGHSTNASISGFWFDAQGRDVEAIGTPWTRGGTSQTTTTFPGLAVGGAREVLLVGTDRTFNDPTIASWTPSSPTVDFFTRPGPKTSGGHVVAHFQQAVSGTTPTYVATLTLPSGNAVGVQMVLAAGAQGPDTTAPTVPASVTATSAGASSISLTWAASADDRGVVSYRVRRNGVDLPGALAVTDTTYVDRGLSPTTTYSYTVSAVDAAGNRSAESAVASATTTTTTVVASATWSSETSSTTLGLGWIINTGDLVQAIASLSPDLSDPIVGSAATRPPSGWVNSRISGLAPATLYYTGVRVDGDLIPTGRGQYRTLMDQVAWSRVIAGSCNITGSAHAVFTRIKTEAPDFFVHMGDIHYPTFNQDVPDALWRDNFKASITSATFAPMLASVTMRYDPDNHDGPNSNDGAGAGAPWSLRVSAAVRELTGEVYAAPGQGFYKTWTHAGVRYIEIDRWTFRSPSTAANGPTKTMLGATQKAWFINLLKTSSEAAIVVMGGFPNYSNLVTGGRWGSFPDERVEIGNVIAALPAEQRKKLVFIGGDSHSICADDGTNAMWGVPSLNASPLNQSGGLSSGIWNITNLDVDDGRGYFSRLTFSPVGNNLNFTWDAVQDDGTVMASWSTSFPIPVTPDPPTVALDLEAEFGGLTITAFTNDYRPLGRIGDYLKAMVSWEWLAPGAGEIQLAADHWLVPVAMTCNTTVIPVVVSVNGVTWTGRVASVTREHAATDAAGSATVSLVDDWAWLQSILAWTEPTKVARSQGLSVPVTGKLATIGCQIINDNVARLGVPVMAICPIQDTSAVTTITPALSSLADYLTPVFKEQNWSLTANVWLPGDQQPVGYVPVTGNLTALVPTLTSPTVLIQARPNPSKPWVRWSDTVGGIISDTVSIEDPRAYRSLLGGSGAADTRIYAEYIDAVLQATLGRFGLPEVFATVQTRNGLDTVDDVLAQGPTQQVANAGAANVSVTIQDGLPWRFGKDYFVGDIPRVELDGVTLVDKPIVSVVATDDAQSGLVFTPTIGDRKVQATSDAMIVDVVQRIAAQLRQLQTGK